MEIQNLNQYNSALTKVQAWLQRGIYNSDSFKEVEIWVEAIEQYTGMPLPARHFIQNNCSKEQN